MFGRGRSLGAGGEVFVLRFGFFRLFYRVGYLVGGVEFGFGGFSLLVYREGFYFYLVV